MGTILENSIWPNGLKRDEKGHAIFYPLGTNKINISTSSIQWPKGDKLISPFVYQDDKLVGFIDTKALITDSQVAIYLPYEYIEAEFSAIDKGQLQIHAPNATTKKASWKDSGKEDIPEAQFKYKGCTTVDNVKTVDANYQTTDIVDGVWSEPLWDLTNGTSMFWNCDNLKSFTSDLSSLTNGQIMFCYCRNLTSFSSDLGSLTYGDNMFSSCTSLISFSSDLSSLMTGSAMFSSCTSLISFSSDLGSLKHCPNMFSKCKLDAPSVSNIVDSIPQRDDKPISTTGEGNILIGIGIINTDEAKQAFAEECDYNDWAELNKEFDDKNWGVQWQFNGETTTFDLRSPRPSTTIYARLEETEDYADYTSGDGSKKYRLNWFHETTGSTEGYTRYTTLEEAVAHFNIKPIENQ